MVMFAYKLIEDKPELERPLMNEKVVFDKLQPLTGWAIHRCYGEYVWYGGRHLCFLTRVRPRQTLLLWTSQHWGSKRRVIICGHLNFFSFSIDRGQTRLV
jgi:hypothetical protein